MGAYKANCTQTVGVYNWEIHNQASCRYGDQQERPNKWVYAKYTMWVYVCVSYAESHEICARRYKQKTKQHVKILLKYRVYC